MRVGVAFQHGQVRDAELPGQRRHRQQLSDQILDPTLVFRAGPGEPVGGPDPTIQRGLLGAGQHQRPQPGRVEQRQPGEAVGVDPVGLGVPGQEPAQIGSFGRADPCTTWPRRMKNTAIGSHAGPVGSTTTSSRVPSGAPANAVVSTSVRLGTVGHALRFAIVCPVSSSTRTVCALAIPISIPTSRRVSSSAAPFLGDRYPPASPDGDALPATVPRKTRADRGSHSCAANGSNLDGPSHSPHPGHPWPARCGNQSNGAQTHRDLPRSVLDATTQTSRDDHATLEPQPHGGPMRSMSLT